MTYASTMNGHDSSATFPSYMLSLLASLEASPATFSRSLQQFPPPTEFAPPCDLSKPSVETDNIISSLSRIAERLARSESVLPPKLQQLDQGAVVARLGNNAVVKNESDEKLAELREKELKDKARETPENQLGSPITNWDDETEAELSAAEELRLLKAQVRDFARVCKVSNSKHRSRRSRVKIPPLCNYRLSQEEISLRKYKFAFRVMT
jgi:hypothetical protein